jgi:hypothetical protein
MDTVATLMALFGQVHQQIREELDGLDDAALNWVPTPGANSVATIINHLLGSESETLHSVAGVAYQRDRTAEFAAPHLAGSQVRQLLQDADDLISELGPRIDARRLDEAISLPTLPATDRRTGLAWMIGNLGHAREHLGHIQLTCQLLRSSPRPLP